MGSRKRIPSLLSAILPTMLVQQERTIGKIDINGAVLLQMADCMYRAVLWANGREHIGPPARLYDDAYADLQKRAEAKFAQMAKKLPKEAKLRNPRFVRHDLRLDETVHMQNMTDKTAQRKLPLPENVDAAIKKIGAVRERWLQMADGIYFAVSSWKHAFILELFASQTKGGTLLSYGRPKLVETESAAEREARYWGLCLLRTFKELKAGKLRNEKFWLEQSSMESE